jgi:hypothetical protein
MSFSLPVLGARPPVVQADLKFRDHAFVPQALRVEYTRFRICVISCRLTPLPSPFLDGEQAGA